MSTDEAVAFGMASGACLAVCCWALGRAVGVLMEWSLRRSLR
ncbi:hypothetical protein [Pseudolysinimonas kribbensis]|nr:hypothetical protein [Pseudolysinimonas kribbensis]